MLVTENIFSTKKSVKMLAYYAMIIRKGHE